MVPWHDDQSFNEQLATSEMARAKRGSEGRVNQKRTNSTWQVDDSLCQPRTLVLSKELGRWDVIGLQEGFQSLGLSVQENLINAVGDYLISSTAIEKG